jgi:membrane protein DedA with SNARE-associated domain
VHSRQHRNAVSMLYRAAAYPCHPGELNFCACFMLAMMGSLVGKELLFA